MFQTTNQVTMCHYVRLCVTLFDCLSSLPKNPWFAYEYSFFVSTNSGRCVVYCSAYNSLIEVAIFRIPLDYNKDRQT